MQMAVGGDSPPHLNDLYFSWGQISLNCSVLALTESFFGGGAVILQFDVPAGFGLLNTRIVCSNPTRGMDIRVFFCVCFFLFAMDRSLAKGVLPIVYMFHNFRD
jgi:hypothetical protein